MKRSSELKRVGFKPRAAGAQSTLKRTELKRGTKTLKPGGQLARQGKPMKSRGMKGRAPTTEEQRFMDAVGSLPCIACMKDGRHETVISLHHIDGRTKPGAHLMVLPLCGPHHQQDDSDLLKRPSVHGRKATFTARYGTELELLTEVRALLARAQDPPLFSSSVAL